MQPASSEFNAAAKASIRKPRARVTITWTDPFIDTTIETSTNDQNYANFRDQTADTVINASKKWFHLDGVTPLSETTFVMPDPTPENKARYQIGWWGATPCGVDSLWSGVNPLLTTTFNPRPLEAVRVVGDDKWGEYPVDFIVRVYRGALLALTINVTDNDSVLWEQGVASSNLINVDKMELEVVKWSRPSRVVKITEFYTSVLKVYDGDDIMEMSILEETDFKNGSLPIGNISSNEIDLKIQNADDLLFPDNTSSELYTVVKPSRKIFAEMGFELPSGVIEYVPMGVFWSGDWDTPLDDVAVSTTGRDRVYRLTKTEFRGGQLYENNTLYQLADIVLTDAQQYMPDMEYYIDPEFGTDVIPAAFFEPETHAKVLKKIVAAGLGFMYADRSGIVRIMTSVI